MRRWQIGVLHDGPALKQRLICTQQTRDIELMLSQCWPAVYDVGQK